MSDGQLNADVQAYLQAAGMNLPPPAIGSDPLVAGSTPIEQLLRVLGVAANAGDLADNTESADEHARRDATMTGAAEKFAAQDEQAAQQIPQMAAGIAGALTGALGAMLAPVAQIPQQISQGAQQALQAGLGMLRQTGHGTVAGLGDGPLAEDEDFGIDDTVDLEPLAESAAGFDGGGGSFGGGGILGATTPTAVLGPPPVPSASTFPSSAPPTPSRVDTPATSVPAVGSGMAGMPLVPPGPMSGAGGADRDPKTDTRRVSVPPVRNGAPVQGRITTPPAVPTVTKKVEGKPVASRRIMLPADAGNDGGSV